MTRKKSMLRCVFLVIVSLLIFPTMADLVEPRPRRTCTYHALSHAEWMVARGKQLMLNGIGGEANLRVAVFVGGAFICFMVIVLLRRKRVITTELMVVLFLGLLSWGGILWIFIPNLIDVPTHHIVAGVRQEATGDDADVTVDPNPGETYEEYLKRVGQYNSPPSYVNERCCAVCGHGLERSGYCSWCESRKSANECPRCGRSFTGSPFARERQCTNCNFRIRGSL